MDAWNGAEVLSPYHSHPSKQERGSWSLIQRQRCTESRWYTCYKHLQYEPGRLMSGVGKLLFIKWSHHSASNYWVKIAEGGKTFRNTTVLMAEYSSQEKHYAPTFPQNIQVGGGQGRA